MNCSHRENILPLLLLIVNTYRSISTTECTLSTVEPTLLTVEFKLLSVKRTRSTAWFTLSLTKNSPISTWFASSEMLPIGSQWNRFRGDLLSSRSFKTREYARNQIKNNKSKIIQGVSGSIYFEALCRFFAKQRHFVNCTGFLVFMNCTWLQENNKWY